MLSPDAPQPRPRCCWSHERPREAVRAQHFDASQAVLRRASAGMCTAERCRIDLPSAMVSALRISQASTAAPGSSGPDRAAIPALWENFQAGTARCPRSGCDHALALSITNVGYEHAQYAYRFCCRQCGHTTAFFFVVNGAVFVT